MMSRTSGILLGASLFAFVTFSSCGGSFGKSGNDSADMKDALEKAIAENNLVKVESGGYKVSIPKHLVPDTSLNDVASLQYADLEKNLYIIVIDESKTDFIKTFSDADGYDDNFTPEKNYRITQMNSMKDKMAIKGEPVTTKATINGLDAETVAFTASVPGIDYDIYYKLAFIEGTKNIYKAMTWTLASEKASNEDEMDQMLQSFKLIDAK